MKDGGTAFPIHVPSTSTFEGGTETGMTLHEYYVGQALPKALQIVAERINHTETGQDITEEAARVSIKAADAVIAMLAEREKQG